MSVPNILDFLALEFKVSNAKSAATYFITRYGFEHVARKCLDPENRDYAKHAVSNGQIVFIFCSDVKIAKEVDNSSFINDYVSVIHATATNGPFSQYCLYGDVILQLWPENSPLEALFPTDDHWSLMIPHDPLNDHLPQVKFERLDHVVGNQREHEMTKVCERLETDLGLHRYWSVDDSIIHTEYSSLRSIVMASPNERFLLPINEPAEGRKKSNSEEYSGGQIQEYIDYNGGPGVQHIALKTEDIIATVRALKARGVEFLHVPQGYYSDLEARLKDSKVTIKEDMDVIKSLNLLVDFDDNGYLLQIFTEPFDYRPTLFFEVIQRNNFTGFGAGNFKALFEALENAQELRGNL